MEKLFIVTAGEEIVGIMTFRDAVAYGFGLKDGSSIAMEALEEPKDVKGLERWKRKKIRTN